MVRGRTLLLPLLCQKNTMVYTLRHGCARVAHCVTARWRNLFHYCRPLRHYDVWLRVLITEKHWQPRRQHTVYRNKRLEFATEQVGKLRYVTAMDGGLKPFPWVAWFAHPWSTSTKFDKKYNQRQTYTKWCAQRNWMSWKCGEAAERLSTHYRPTNNCRLRNMFHYKILSSLPRLKICINVFIKFL